MATGPSSAAAGREGGGQQQQRPRNNNTSTTTTSTTSKSSGTSLLADIASNLGIPDNLITKDAESAAARFDVSPFRLWLLFQSVDENHDGYITKDELINALLSVASSSSTTTTTTQQSTNDERADNDHHHHTTASVAAAAAAAQREEAETKTEEEEDDDDDEEEGMGKSEGEDEEDSDDNDEMEKLRMSLQDIQALDELLARIISGNNEHDSTRSSTFIIGNNSSNPAAEELRQKEKKEGEEEVDGHDDDDDQTMEFRNVRFPSSSTTTNKRATTTSSGPLPLPPPPGISFPQFCRIMRYLWLQQLLNPQLDNSADENNAYTFECVDYSSGYYRHKKIIGNVSNGDKRTRDFFQAPRHGNARMRWIDVPSGTFVNVPSDANGTDQRNQYQHNNNQRDSFRITILRLAVKYRFHPTSIEDAIDLDYQEPKVNSFEHSLLDLGNFNCGTISWLRNAGVSTAEDGGGGGGGVGTSLLVDHEDVPTNQQLGDWAKDCYIMNTATPTTTASPLLRRTLSGKKVAARNSINSNNNDDGDNNNNNDDDDDDDDQPPQLQHRYHSMPNLPPPNIIPRPPRTHARTSSTASFHSYQREAAIQGRVFSPPPSFTIGANNNNYVPDFVMTEGDDDVITMNEGRHYFITIPMFELSRRSQTSLDLFKDASDFVGPMELKPLTIEVNEATLGIFVASLPDANLVVTCSTKWRPTRIRPFQEYLRSIKKSYSSRRSRWSKRQRPGRGGRRQKQRRQRPIINFSSRTRRRRRRLNSVQNKTSTSPQGYGSFADGYKNDVGGGGGGGGFWDHDDSSSDSDNENDSDDDDDDDDRYMQSMLEDEKLSLERVKDMLKKRHSIQRHRNSNWLMHAIIDAVVDKLGPISKIYEAQLQRMSTRLFELQHQISKEEVKEMIVMKRDLEWLQHELRPFARVIRHLIDDRNIGIEVTHYLEDVEDNLLRTLEELSSYASECTSLKDEYNAYLDRRMNDILYVLTLVTTLIVPGQFFTGYYGMNFENQDTGELGIPLLKLGSLGVVIFWCMTLGCTGIVALLMYRYQFFDKGMK